MGNFLPKYPKNYFKNQKGLRSFWRMISIGIIIFFGILACIDKFEKQWELNVFYFGIHVFNILGKETRMIAYRNMEKAVQKRQICCKNNGLMIGI